MAEQNGSQQRPASSDSPNSYPSPQMQPAYNYPPSQGGQNAESYRQSPNGSNMSLPPLSLPPLRAMDGQGQQQVQHIPAQVGAMAGHPMAPYYPGPPQPMAHPGQSMHNMATAQLMRYPIPAHGAGDMRTMSGGRHKKEIKRRTKTGCLTCRKRRIKCDEEHPVCRNCTKSKRECLGYDPIFKQERGTQQLQPAQSASPSSTSSTPRNSTSNLGTSTSAPQPHSYVALSGSSSGNFSAPKPSHHTYELSSAIDPALAAADAAAKISQAQTLPGSNSKPREATVKPSTGDIRAVAVAQLFVENQQLPFDVLEFREPLSASALNDIKLLYTNDFAPGFDGLLDVKWYSKHGINGVLQNTEACKLTATLIHHYNNLAPPGQPAGSSDADVTQKDRTKALECKTVWELLSLIRSSSAGANISLNGDSASFHRERDEAIKRLECIDALLTNRVLQQNPLHTIKYEDNISPVKKNEIEFWELLGQFLTIRVDNDNLLWVILMKTRDLLNGAENRDVIYSSMISRYFADRVVGFPDFFHANPHKGEEDPVNKAFIAKNFLKNQALYNGTNHPIQRISHMAVRSWSFR